VKPDTGGRPEKHSSLKSWDMEFPSYGSVSKRNLMIISSLGHRGSNVHEVFKT
jgi:hypothetical protein